MLIYIIRGEKVAKYVASIPNRISWGGNTGPQDNRNTMIAMEEILGCSFFLFGQTSFQEEANFRGVGHHFFNVVSFSEANIMGEKKVIRRFMPCPSVGCLPS